MIDRRRYGKFISKILPLVIFLRKYHISNYLRIFVLHLFFSILLLLYFFLISNNHIFLPIYENFGFSIIDKTISTVVYMSNRAGVLFYTVKLPFVSTSVRLLFLGGSLLLIVLVFVLGCALCVLFVLDLCIVPNVDRVAGRVIHE